MGFYGSRVRVGCGSLGGWDAFGPHRIVTRSEGNVRYEIDGEPALDLYKRYLGAHALGLPANALLFPLALRTGIDENSGRVVFACDVPTGAYVRFMHANFDRLVDGAIAAAEVSRAPLGAACTLAVLISCVGRKLVLKQRVEEEVEGVRDTLGSGVTLAGFYSYGEISPFTPSARCELHNQTMTVTTFAEVEDGA